MFLYFTLYLALRETHLLSPVLSLFFGAKLSSFFDYEKNPFLLPMFILYLSHFLNYKTIQNSIVAPIFTDQISKAKKQNRNMIFHINRKIFVSFSLIIFL